MLTRKEQAAASRAHLIEAAGQSFTESGYDGTTVAGILERAGMARGALYHYFPGGKAEIFHAVFEERNEAFHRRRDALMALPSPLRRLREGVRLFLELCTEEDFARIVLADAPRLIAGQGGLGSSYALLHKQVTEAQQVGEFKPLDVDVTARALYGAMRCAGESVVASHDREATVLEATRVIDAFLEGLSPGPTR